MKSISATVIPPVCNLVGAVKSRWKEGSLEHEALTGSANNPGPNSCDVTSFILTQTSFLARCDKIELKTELTLSVAPNCCWKLISGLPPFCFHSVPFFFWKSSRRTWSRLETLGHGMELTHEKTWCYTGRASTFYHVNHLICMQLLRLLLAVD